MIIVGKNRFTGLGLNICVCVCVCVDRLVDDG